MRSVLFLRLCGRFFPKVLLVVCINTGRSEIVATFPFEPQRVTELTGEPNADYASVDFNLDGHPEFYMNSGGIYLGLALPNRVFILRSPPPNLGGLVANLVPRFSLHRDSVLTRHGWYEGFPSDSFTANWPEVPTVAVVDFGACRTDGCVSLFLQRSGYIGIEMNLEGSTHYGWVHVNNQAPNGDALGIGGYLDAWAYETVPDRPIAVGAVPEPGACTLLGASLLLLLGRRRAFGIRDGCACIFDDSVDDLLSESGSSCRNHQLQNSRVPPAS